MTYPNVLALSGLSMAYTTVSGCCLRAFQNCAFSVVDRLFSTEEQARQPTVEQPEITVTRV